MYSPESLLCNYLSNPKRNAIPTAGGTYYIQTPEGIYIGSTKNLRTRFTQHRGYCTRKTSRGVLAIQQSYAINPDAISFHVIAYIEDEDLRIASEQALVDKFKPKHNSHVQDVKSPLGLIRSESSRSKMSKTKSMMYLGEGNPMFGKNHKEETKLKIAKARLGRKLGKQSAETIAKRVAATKATKAAKLLVKKVQNGQSNT